MLEKVDLFFRLSEDEIHTLEGHATVRSYRKGTVLMEKGAESSALYVLREGKVRIYASHEDGKEVVLEVLDRPGAHFGVMALLSGSPRTASVATLEDCRFMVVSREDFLNCLRLSPNIALDIMAHLVEKVGLLTERMSSFALDDVYSRLAVSLMQLAQEEGGRLITPPVTQQDLAGMINASREMVSRIFKELKAGDYIEIEGKRIVLKKTLPAGW